MPQHAFDLKITDHYAPQITAALRTVFPESLLRSAVQQVSARVVKAPADPQEDLLRTAARAALNSGVGAGTDLEAVLRGVFADGFASGAYSSGQQLGSAAVTLQGVAAMDWSTWKPGDPIASALASDGGLAKLLDGAGVGVNGITGTLLDQLGNTIGDGLLAGDSVDTVTASLAGIVDDPARAERIAHTETARAMTAATMATYQANGVGQWGWILSDDACPECVAQADANPHDVGDGDQPPLHPFCRCAVAPSASSVNTTGTADSAGGVGGSGLLDDAALALGDDLLSGFAGGDAAAEADAADAAARDAVDAGAQDAADASDAEVQDDLSSVSDDDLGARLGTTTDPAEIDRIMGELDARDKAAEQARKADEAKARAKARRDAKSVAQRAAQDQKYEELVAAGNDPMEAYAEAFGKDVEKLRVKEAIAAARANGYVGRSLEELARDMQKDWAERAWRKAEDDTRGHLLSHEAEQINASISQKSISAKSLFSGSDARARRWASDELLEWWEQHGRLTVDDFKAGLLGGKIQAKGYFL